MAKICLIVLSALAVAHVSSFPRGAPSSTCGSMVPIHMLFSAQRTKAPFSLFVENTASNAGPAVKVTLQSDADVPFKGYLIEARADGSNNALGTFDVTESNGKTLDCQGGVSNAVTHAEASNKTIETFVWNAPEGFQGQVTFKSTVVVGFRTFYTDLVSSAVTVA